MKTPTLSPELKTVLKKLKLGQIIAALPERMVLAEKQNLSLDETLLLVLSDEVTRRDSTACTRRAAKAGLDPDKRHTFEAGPVVCPSIGRPVPTE